MERREIEAQLLREKAESCLKQPIRLTPTLPRTELLPILRLWNSPSFSANKSWCIYKPTGIGSARYNSSVIETCWDMPSEYKRMMNPLEGLKSGFRPDPTITIRFAAFELGRHSTLLELRNGMSLALSAKLNSVYVDGEVWGFENFDYFQGSRLQWWGDGPSDWQALIKTFHCLVAEIQATLSSKDFQPYQPELRVEPLNEVSPL